MQKEYEETVQKKPKQTERWKWEKKVTRAEKKHVIWNAKNEYVYREK